MENLQWLDLMSNNLTGLPVEIGRLKQLRCLNLSMNKRHNLPSEIGNLKNLETIDLQDNNLKSLPVKYFQDMPNLTLLALSGNPLSPGEITAIRRAMPGCTVIW